MSNNSAPNLSNYFGTSDNPKSKSEDVSFSGVLSETTNKISKLSFQENEPEVCRLFAEAPVQPRDPTALFFDLISTSTTVKTDDDGFYARVAVGSEADRRRDSWIPSERTRQSLIACATSAPGTYVPEKELLTMPGVLLEEELSDTMGETVSSCLGEAEAIQRRVLTANDVTQDERGLRELIQARSYRSAINLTSKLLTIYGQGPGRAGHPTKHSPHSLQLWFTRLSLLIKIKQFTLAQEESEPFGQLDNPDLFYQFYPEMYGSRPGSIASFSLRLILAELPMHCGKPKESLTKLFNMLSVVKQMLTNLKNDLCEDGSPTEINQSDRSDSIQLWYGREGRIMHSIINSALAIKDYELAMDLLGQLCDRDGAPRHSLLSALGRLHLQLGDVAGAEVCFNEAKEHEGEDSQVRELVDRGLIAIAQNNFADAYISFQQANVLDPNNIMILNNMAVCLLYGGHLKDAITALEKAITESPVQALQESLLLNLCTLYDMESSKGRQKKFALLKQLAKYQADAPAQILEKLYG